VRRFRACAAAGTALTGAALALGLPQSAGCYTTQCDPIAPRTYSGGEMIDDDTYETSPIQEPDGGSEAAEPWIPYPGNLTLTVTFPPAAAAVIGQRTPAWIEPYVGVSAQPSASESSNYILASGALAEFTPAPNGFTVLNDTCASYFARFVVHFPSRSGPAQVPLDASE